MVRQLSSDLTRPSDLKESAVPFWELMLGSFDGFEPHDAPLLGLLCNLYALSAECQKMCFSSRDGKPMPFIDRRMLSGGEGDPGLIPNPYLDQLSGIERQIERVSAALGIIVHEKLPSRDRSETPLDRAIRQHERKAEVDGDIAGTA